MKSFLSPLCQYTGQLLYCFGLMICLSFFSCVKPDNPNQTHDKPSAFSSLVIDKWMTLELRLFKNATGIGNGAFARPFACSGISAFEATDPGKDSWQSIYNGIPALPQSDKSRSYHWAASVNAALAEFNRKFFTSANSKQADIAAIDSLENALFATFDEKGPASLAHGVAFGKAIADAVFSWSESDGYQANNALAYTPPAGPGLWEPTPPAFAPAGGVYWGNDRPMILSSGANTKPALPVTYSESPTSPFYKMVADLYQASGKLTTDQKNQAMFWRDVPGVATPGHWMSITQQAIRQSNSRLDKAAQAFALVGISVNEAVINVFKYKYVYNQVRPVTYIRKVIGDTAWLSYIATPAHPEYPAAHAVVSAAAAEALTAAFGNIGAITDHTWDYLGFPVRTFKTFDDIAADAGMSRFYGGIHYMPSIEAGFKEGRTVGKNVVSALHTGEIRK